MYPKFKVYYKHDSKFYTLRYSSGAVGLRLKRLQNANMNTASMLTS